jgi:hypothetical protein
MSVRGGIFVVAMASLWIAAPALAAPQQPATPLEQYQALVKDYQASTQGGTKSEEQRQKDRDRLQQLPARFLALAEQVPGDPIAVDALTMVLWVEGNTSHPAGGSDSAGGRALAILQRDHVLSDRLAAGCLRLSSCIRKECEPFLRAVLARNPHREVQAACCVSLAWFLDGHRRLAAQPELQKRHAELLDREYLAALQKQDPAGLGREIEGLLERVIAQYGDVELPDYGNAGARAKSALHELRHLSVGNEAPDIEGEDQHGVRFKLSDYRGKVVLLDFWQQH